MIIATLAAISVAINFILLILLILTISHIRDMNRTRRL